MAVERVYGGSSLIDILDRILDKGLVIDAWVRVSLVGIELITIEARVVVASVDTYLRYAQAIGLTPMASRPPDQNRMGGNGGQGSEGPGKLLEGVTKQLGGGQGGGQDIGGQLQQLLDQLQQSGGGQQPDGGATELADQLRGILDQLQKGGDGQGAAVPQAQGG